MPYVGHAPLEHVQGILDRTRVAVAFARVHQRGRTRPVGEQHDNGRHDVARAQNENATRLL